MKEDKYLKRLLLREEYRLHMLRASSEFKPTENPRLKISKKEKLFVLARMVFDKACSNLTGE